MSVYAMRMAAVFTLSVSTVGLRTGRCPGGCRWSGTRRLVLLVTADVQKWAQLLFPAWVLLVSVVIL